MKTIHCVFSISALCTTLCCLNKITVMEKGKITQKLLQITVFPMFIIHWILKIILLVKGNNMAGHPELKFC